MVHSFIVTLPSISGLCVCLSVSVRVCVCDKQIFISVCSSPSFHVTKAGPEENSFSLTFPLFKFPSRLIEGTNQRPPSLTYKFVFTHRCV